MPTSSPSTSAPARHWHLITVEELELRPGETRELKLSVDPDARYIGIVAAYRNLPETRWRYTLPLDVQGITRATLSLDASGLRVLSPDEEEKRRDRD